MHWGYPDLVTEMVLEVVGVPGQLHDGQESLGCRKNRNRAAGARFLAELLQTTPRVYYRR
jgi:hypothetical protein